MIKEFIIPVYGEDSLSKIILVISDSENGYNKNISKLIKKYNIHEETTFYEWWDFRAFIQLIHSKDKVTHFLISWKKGEKDISTLVHETVHLVNYIFESRGVKYGFNNDEVFTYYQEKIFNMLYPYLFFPAKAK